MFSQIFDKTLPLCQALMSSLLLEDSQIKPQFLWLEQQKDPGSKGQR